MDWQDRTAIDPKVMGGKPVIKGTRSPVQVIVGALAGGDSVAEICEDYGLTEEEVPAGLPYAAEMLSQERLRALPR